MNYGELKANVADWLNRADLVAQIPVFVALAEAQFNNDPRGRVRDSMMVSTTVLTKGQTEVPVPPRYLRMEQLRVLDSGRHPTRDLDFMTLNQLSHFVGERPTPAEPEAYAVAGQVLRFHPAPGADATTVEMTYYSLLPALVDDADENWLLTREPGVYLYGTLVQAEPYLKNDARVGLWQGLYDSHVEGMHVTDQWAQYSGAPIKMRSRSF